MTSLNNSDSPLQVLVHHFHLLLHKPVSLQHDLQIQNHQPLQLHPLHSSKFSTHRIPHFLQLLLNLSQHKTTNRLSDTSTKNNFLLLSDILSFVCFRWAKAMLPNSLNLQRLVFLPYLIFLTSMTFTMI